MIHGLPVTSHQSLMDFRSFLNTSLNQHVIVAAPLLPEWKIGLKQYAVKRGFEELFLIVITGSGQGAYCPLRGGAFFSIGNVDFQQKGAVILASLRKNNAFLGGIFTILDIFSYDALNVLSMPHLQRFSFAKYITESIKLPSRYSFEIAEKYSSKLDLYQYDTFGVT